jgi:hypothetical protein
MRLELVSAHRALHNRMRKTERCHEHAAIGQSNPQFRVVSGSSNDSGRHTRRCVSEQARRNWFYAPLEKRKMFDVGS